MSIAKAICFIACHGGPADHFATFAEHLVQDGYEIQVYASGPALKKFQDHQIEVIEFDAENPLKLCVHAAVVLTDVGHAFDIQLQETLKIEAPEVLRLAYYDNPEPYVPGGYSDIAAKVMRAADRTLFANSNLATDSPRHLGLGYYPTSQAEKVIKRREQEHDKMRVQLLEQHSIEDRGQKIIVYFGGNNEEYFTKAFPAFLKFLQDIDTSDFIFLIQQHPGAKNQNRDGLQLPDNRSIILSDWSSDDAQVVADAALYYQTSMGPLFALANIPTIQVGHETYADILVRNNLCPTATTAADLSLALSKLEERSKTRMDQAIILDGLGIKTDWFERLKSAVN